MYSVNVPTYLFGTRREGASALQNMEDGRRSEGEAGAGRGLV